MAVNNRKKNSQTGQYEDDPVFIECEAWNRERGMKLADLIETLHKGSQVFLEGHLKLDQWTDHGGGKRSAIRVVVENLQFLDPRRDAPRQRSEPDDEFDPPAPARVEEQIPF